MSTQSAADVWLLLEEFDDTLSGDKDGCDGGVSGDALLEDLLVSGVRPSKTQKKQISYQNGIGILVFND